MNNYVYKFIKKYVYSRWRAEVRDKNTKLYKTTFKNGTGYMKVYDDSLGVLWRRKVRKFQKSR